MDAIKLIFDIIPKTSFVVWFFLMDGSNAVLRLGRSRNGYKKLRKSLSIIDKITKLKYVSLSKRVIGYQKFFVAMTYLGYLCLLVFLSIALISIFTGDFWTPFNLFLYIKSYLVEFPAFIFVAINQRRPRDGVGLVWKFERDYGNR